LPLNSRKWITGTDTPLPPKKNRFDKGKSGSANLYAQNITEALIFLQNNEIYRPFVLTASTSMFYKPIFNVKDGNLYHEGRGSGFLPRHDGIHSPVITVSTAHTMSNLYTRIHNSLITRDTTT
jgi:hypothetical protein